jgi:hypothetical protein
MCRQYATLIDRVFHLGPFSRSTKNGTRVLLPITLRPLTLIVLTAAVMLLVSCATTRRNSFLGPELDGPTAAYGYNHP